MRYVLNLAAPMALTSIGVLIMTVLASLTGKGGMLHAVGGMARVAFPFVAIATLTVAAWGGYRYYRILRWERGERDGDCHHCGGDTAQLTGRYGPYVKCRMCGGKREGWR